MSLEIFPIKKALTTAEVLALNGTPIELIAAPIAGLANIVIDAQYFLDFNSIAYASNINLQIEAVGSNQVMYESNTLSSVNDFFSAMNRVPGAANEDQIVDGAAIQAIVETGNPTAGNSPIIIYLSYITIQV